MQPFAELRKMAKVPFKQDPESRFRILPDDKIEIRLRIPGKWHMEDYYMNDWETEKLYMLKDKRANEQSKDDYGAESDEDGFSQDSEFDSDFSEDDHPADIEKEEKSILNPAFTWDQVPERLVKQTEEFYNLLMDDKPNEQFQ